MKNTFRAIVIMFLFTFCWGINVSSVKADNIEQELIVKYYNAINDEEWASLLDTLGTEYSQTISATLESEYYAINRIGIYNVDKVNEIELLETIENEAMYLTILEECEGDDITIYLVKSDLSVYEEDEFYKEGTNYTLFFIGTVEGERKIVSTRMPLTETVAFYAGEEEAQVYQNERLGLSDTGRAANGCLYNRLPNSVKVKRWKYGDGSIETVDLKQYVKIVSAREIGYVSRAEAYHYAGILAVRNYAWYHIMTADANLGYHVTDTNAKIEGVYKSYQIYNPNEYWNEEVWATLYNRVDNIWNMNFFSSNYDRVFSWYTSEDGLGTQHSGRMNLKTANDLANSGWNYQQILNYFYGYSEASSSNLRFISVGEHVYYTTTIDNGVVLYHCKCGHTGTSQGAIG